MDNWRETEGKRVHDPFYCYGRGDTSRKSLAAAAEEKFVRVVGPLIVGAGPSGLAVAACLKESGVPSVVLERSDCIASLWQHKTYDRLRLHLPKHYCELPHMPFPSFFPTYPTKQQFLSYLEVYARHFDINPVFNQAVDSAEYDHKLGLWRVKTTAQERVGVKVKEAAPIEYVCPWLVVATGENADIVIPQIEGMEEFSGSLMHTSSYRRGEAFRGKKVLVVGCGNSGMEICLDLCNYGAHPTLVVRDAVHVLPREILGSSTFGLSMWLMKWLPVRTVDRLLLLLSRLTLGDTARLGLDRPQLGPLEMKATTGKTPVLDVGTLAKIRSGDVKISPAIERLTKHGAQFIDGRAESFDAVILATGYKSNVPFWLKDGEHFSEKTGLPRRPFPHGWKGEHGLYAVGFTQRGILGATTDAKKVARDIEQQWNAAHDRGNQPIAKTFSPLPATTPCDSDC